MEEMKRGRFLAELKRRNVIRAAILYLGAVWALAQGIAQLGPSVGAPEWTTRWFLVAAAIGFPFWIVFSWFYEFTPSGLKRESEIEASSIPRHTGRKLDLAIIGVLTLAVVLLLTDRFVRRHGDETIFSPITENSIAVLPFVNMSGEKANEYFSDGISEELLNLLTKVPQLQVAARTSSFSFKGRPIEIPEIGRQLRVANVLEGSVRKSGDRVRITAQLIRAGEGFHLWSETYDRKLDDIFKIQDEIAAEVVKQLKVRLLGAAPTVRQTDPQAYMLYLQAVQLGRQNTPEAFTQSDALYRQVLEIDPRYAPAWRELSRNFTNEADAGLLTNSEGYARAREAGEKALAIDPNYASAHSGLGWIAMANHDFAKAAKHFERALALDSNDLSVLGNSAAFLQALGRVEEALAIQQALVRRDPVNVTALYNLGYTQRVMREFDPAIATYRRVLSLSPGYASARYQICVAMLLKNDASAALAEIEQENNEPARLIGLPMVYHALGRREDSKSALARLIARFEKDWSYNIAQVYAFQGEADKAFEWLDKAVAYQDPGLSDIVRENLFDNLHSDRRWLPFLRQLGLAPEQLANIQFKVTLRP
jgi:TolB-like protein/Tfp pilus assembly protein PilF